MVSLLFPDLCYRLIELVLSDIGVVKGIPALRTEFGWILGIFRFPATFVTLVQWLAGRFLGTTFRAELTLVDCTAGAGPSVR